MKFSKEKFLQAASEQDKKQYEKHLHILDGMEVEHGSLIRDHVDGKPWILYPVKDAWCDR